MVRVIFPVFSDFYMENYAYRTVYTLSAKHEVTDLNIFFMKTEFFSNKRDFCRNGWNKTTKLFPLRQTFAKISKIKESLTGTRLYHITVIEWKKFYSKIVSRIKSPLSRDKSKIKKKGGTEVLFLSFCIVCKSFSEFRPSG